VAKAPMSLDVSDPKIVGAPQRLYSNFIRGIRALPVRIVF
jgi:hypothetical protein